MANAAVARPSAVEIEQPLREDQRREDDQVLGPLLGPQRGEQAQRGRPARHIGGPGIPHVDVRLGRYAPWRAAGLGYAEKLLTASDSVSYVSNTVSSLVIDSRSSIRLVRFSSFRLPP